MKFRIKKNIKSVNKKGFTLTEVMVSIFVFSVAMVGVSGVLANFVKTSRSTRNLQIGVENAQKAINSITKTARTSNVVYADASRIRILDFSQPDNDKSCIEYQFDNAGKRLNYGTMLMSNGNGQPDAVRIAECLGKASPSMTKLLENDLTGRFTVIKSAPGTVGRVTILIEINQNNVNIPIESTVSLRDYAQSAPL
jgi:prepilin-type N-terminal cleavage/methylation domain-containing protein